MAQTIWKMVMPCEECIRGSQIDQTLTHLPLQNPSEHITATEDAMQTDFVLELPLSGGYQNKVTAMEVLSRYLFAYLATI